MMYLEDVVAGEKPYPDLMVLDLGVGVDSGFEALRFHKSNAIFASKCKVVVWSVVGESQREMCKLLGASHVVCKGDGESALLKAVMDAAGTSQNSSVSL